MKETKREKKQVATAARLVSKGYAANGWAANGVFERLHQFNIYALPVLKELGGFDRDFSKLLDLSSSRLYALFLTNKLKKAKTELEREQIRREAPAAFAEYMADKNELLGRVNTSFSPKALACISYNDRWGEFTIDREEYLKETYIMAETPKELAALDALEAIRDALNAFNWQKVQLKQIFQAEAWTLTKPAGTGKFVIRQDFPRELWEELLKGFNG